MRYQSSFERATLSTILLPLRKTNFPFFSQASIICCTLEIQEEKIVIMSLPL